MQKKYDEIDLDKAEYLITYGYVKDKDMYELAEVLYNKRIRSGWQAPTHAGNTGLFNKVQLPLKFD